MSLKAKLEAVLFVTDKPLKAQAIAAILGEDVQVVRQTILELIHEYEERQGAIEISDEDGYSFQIKDQYAALMDEFLPIEMTNAVLRTLSAIAIKQPITQSQIIGIRGATAYEHIKDLVLRELVSRKEDGRSPILTTTKKFQDYFRLSKDGKSLRQYLKRQMKKRDKEEGQQLSLLPAGSEYGSQDFNPQDSALAGLVEVETPDLPDLTAVLPEVVAQDIDIEPVAEVETKVDKEAFFGAAEETPSYAAVDLTTGDTTV